MSEELTPPRFPTMLRKMWSGGEVQAWIDENWNRRAHPAAPADAAPSVAPEPPTREALAEIVRLHLTSTYHCTRVWEAWHVGTMTEDDFEPASESDMAEEIADAILAAYPPQAHSVAPEPPDVLCWACGIAINTSQPLPVAPEPVAWTLQSELDAAQTTCSAHLWFTNPRNSAWTALFTREQIAAHPPRAPLTDAEIAAIVLRTVYEGDASTPHRDAWAAEIGVPFARAIEAAHGIGGK